MGGVSKLRKKHFSPLDSENHPEILPKRAPIGLLNRFKTHPKRYLNSMQKYHKKLKPKMPNLGSDMGEVFGVLAPKIELQRHLEPSWAPKLKIHEKRDTEVPKINTCCADIVPEIKKKMGIPSTQKNNIRIHVTSFQ